jgi:hypothetical protein
MDPARLGVSQRSAYRISFIAELDDQLNRRLPKPTIAAQSALTAINIVWIGAAQLKRNLRPSHERRRPASASPLRTATFFQMVDDHDRNSGLHEFPEWQQRIVDLRGVVLVTQRHIAHQSIDYK